MPAPGDPYAPDPPPGGSGGPAPGPWAPPTAVPPPGGWPGPPPHDPYARPYAPPPDAYAWPGAPDPSAAPWAGPPAGSELHPGSGGGRPGRSRTVPLVVAVAVVVVGVLAAVGLRVAGPATPLAADPAAGPAAPSRATSTLRPGPAPLPAGSAAVSPTPDPAGTGLTTGLVTFSAAAAAHPQATDVLALLDAHFAAINDQDYDAWTATVDARRAADLPRDGWTRAFRTTRDSDVAVSAVEDTDAGVLVDLEFVSEQEVADAPPDLPAPRICWAARWPVADGRIGAPLRGATTKRAC